MQNKACAIYFKSQNNPPCDFSGNVWVCGRVEFVVLNRFLMCKRLSDGLRVAAVTMATVGWMAWFNTWRRVRRCVLVCGCVCVSVMDWADAGGDKAINPAHSHWQGSQMLYGQQRRRMELLYHSRGTPYNTIPPFYFHLLDFCFNISDSLLQSRLLSWSLVYTHKSNLSDASLPPYWQPHNIMTSE